MTPETLDHSATVDLLSKADQTRQSSAKSDSVLFSRGSAKKTHQRPHTVIRLPFSCLSAASSGLL